MKNERLTKGLFMSAIIVLSVGMLGGCTTERKKEMPTTHMEVEKDSSREIISETVKQKMAKTEEETTKKKKHKKSGKSIEGKNSSSETKKQKSSSSQKSKSDDDCIGMEKAKSIAVGASGINRRKVYVISAYYAKGAYHITLGGDEDKEHIFTINGESGKVIAHDIGYPDDEYEYDDDDEWDDYDDDCEYWDDEDE